MAILNKFAKPTVLVTGATGAIGRAVCRDLVVNGYLVMGLVRRIEDRTRLPYAVIPTIGDVRTPGAWEHAIEQVDILIHLALQGLPSTGPKDRAFAEREAHAIAGVLDGIATCCRRHKKLMIHTFGALLFEPDPDGWARETSDISSGRGFGIRHRIGYPVFQRQRKRGLRAMSVNPAFVYGRGGWFEEGVLKPMSRGESMMIGEGNQTMHYIEAEDAASGYRLAIERGVPGEDYLLADDQPTTLGEFTSLVAREMGAPPPTPVPEEELIPMMGAWAVEAYTTCPKVDSTKARRDLGWAPRYRTIQEGVPVVVRAYRRAMAEPVPVA
jgi:nucleoside-diphosphate-sugar epimerase